MRSTESRARSTRRPWPVAIALLGAAALCVPAFGADVPSIRGTSNVLNTAPDTLSFVQGTVLLDGNRMAQSNVGNTELSEGQELRTRTGKAEVMLNPGVFLRLNDRSEAKMVAESPTQVEVQRGEIGIEVDAIESPSVLQVIDDGVTTQLLKKGYYEFNANSPMVKVFSGQAEVHTRKGAWKAVKPQQEMALASDSQAESRKFQPNPNEDQLMAWSRMRHQNMMAANQQYGSYYPYGEYGWGGPGWGPGWGMGWGPRWGMGMGMGWGW